MIHPRKLTWHWKFMEIHHVWWEIHLEMGVFLLSCYFSGVCVFSYAFSYNQIQSENLWWLRFNTLAKLSIVSNLLQSRRLAWALLTRTLHWKELVLQRRKLKLRTKSLLERKGSVLRKSCLKRLKSLERQKWESATQSDQSHKALLRDNLGRGNLCLPQEGGRNNGTGTSMDRHAVDPCVVYSPTLTIKINQMLPKIPYMDMGVFMKAALRKQLVPVNFGSTNSQNKRLKKKWQHGRVCLRWWSHVQSRGDLDNFGSIPQFFLVVVHGYFDISHCIFGFNVPPPSINECNILINGDDIVFAWSRYSFCFTWFLPLEQIWKAYHYDAKMSFARD